MGGHLHQEPALSRKRLLLDLSRDTSTIFRSRKNPTASVSARQSELPMSSSPILDEADLPRQHYLDLMDHADAEQVESDMLGHRCNRETTSDMTLGPAMKARSSARGDNGAAAEGPSPRAGPSKPRVVVEDVTESQWDAIAQSTVERRRERREKRASARHPPSSPLFKAAQYSDTPPCSSLRTPASTSQVDGAGVLESASDPFDWSPSPPYPLREHLGVEAGDEPWGDLGESSQGTTGRLIRGSASPDKAKLDDLKRRSSPGGDVKRGLRLDVDPPSSRGARRRDVPVTDDYRLSPRNTKEYESLAGRTTAVEALKSQGEEDKENVDPGPSLHDLFADEPAPAPAPSSSRSTRLRPHVHSCKSPTEIFDLTTSDNDDESAEPFGTNDQHDDDDEYDFDDLPFPDIDFANDWDRPSKLPSRRQSPDRAYERRRSSPVEPLPAAHPIVLISDLPPEVQEFYNNHWRRGADQKRKAVDDDALDDDEDELVKTTRKAPTKRGPAYRGGWGFRGRGRGRGFRGRGRGGAKRGRS